ncbi:IS110 family transposase [Gordonia sp. NB41Y]|uniref:IS110 family transposase n=1 Tax=Gordonia sp. NB41Y TaxID=875808 RepID=UPI0006B1C4E8|nr:IS110 family transposase [Gordonia sp. NB41Y]KOY49029.1 transposase [Gordonia sp. NB41Y]WLP89518.1 IS110 family transposase [Gordonia sp. NB41Y]
MIIVGADVQKRSHTFVAVDTAGRQLGTVTVPATTTGHQTALRWAHATFGTDLVWAIEDCRNMSALLERDLLTANQKVVRVAPHLMAEHRKTGRQPGKSDPIDALAVARAAAREPNLPIASHDEVSYTVKALTDYRESLVHERTSKINRVLWRVHAIDPEHEVKKGGLNRAKHQKLLAAWLQTCDRGAVDVLLAIKEVAAIAALTVEINEVYKQLSALVTAAVALPGCGILSAAKLLGESAGISRFGTEAQFARHAGIAPVPVWSGKSAGRHRLTRSGNRQLNAAVHRIALTQSRMPDSLGHAYYAKKRAEGKKSREAMRCLKRRLVRTIFHRLVTDHAARSHTEILVPRAAA